jgi:hypothetical protein
MVTKILVTVVLVATMCTCACACMPAMPLSSEPRSVNHGDYKDGEWEKKYEAPEYTVEKEGDGYEKRVYPPSTWACTNMTVDTAQDPLAGLEDWDFKEIMQSKRYKTRVPSSLMFWPLFGYIGGNNKGMWAR